LVHKTANHTVIKKGVGNKTFNKFESFKRWKEVHACATLRSWANYKFERQGLKKD